MKLPRAIRATWWLWSEVKQQTPGASLKERTRVMSKTSELLVQKQAATDEAEGKP